jgi:hypothetical protein
MSTMECCCSQDGGLLTAYTSLGPQDLKDSLRFGSKGNLSG